jgi:hypothetical protein
MIPHEDDKKDWSFPSRKLHCCWVVVSSTPPPKSVLSFASLMSLLGLQFMGCCWWVVAKCLLGYGAELGCACFAVFVWHFTVTWWAGLFPARLQLLLFLRLVSLSLLICVCVVGWVVEFQQWWENAWSQYSGGLHVKF